MAFDGPCPLQFKALVSIAPAICLESICNALRPDTKNLCESVGYVR